MLAVEKVILIVIFLVILVITGFMIFSGKGWADQLLLQNDLRQCCGQYRAYNCTADPANIYCGNNKFLEDIRAELNITDEQLNASCDCVRD